MSKPKKKVTYESLGKLGAYAVLADGKRVALVRRVRATRPEEWSAWDYPDDGIDKTVHGARTRSVATKAILALLEIEA